MPPLTRFRAAHSSSLAWPPRVARAIIGDGGLAQEPGPRHRRRLSAHRQERVVPRCRLGRPQRDDQRQGQPLEPRREVGQPAKGRPVRPVGIVDRDHEGPASREVGGEPVEAVEDGEGRVVGRRLSELAREQRARGGRRSGQELVALAVLRARQPSLEELTHHAEREARLELRAACAQHLTAEAFRRPHAASSSDVLPIPAPPSTMRTPPRSSSASIAASSRSRSSSSTISL